MDFQTVHIHKEKGNDDMYIFLILVPIIVFAIILVGYYFFITRNPNQTQNNKAAQTQLLQ